MRAPESSLTPPHQRHAHCSRITSIVNSRVREYCHQVRWANMDAGGAFAGVYPLEDWCKPIQPGIPVKQRTGKKFSVSALGTSTFRNLKLIYLGITGAGMTGNIGDGWHRPGPTRSRRPNQRLALSKALAMSRRISWEMNFRIFDASDNAIHSMH